MAISIVRLLMQEIEKKFPTSSVMSEVNEIDRIFADTVFKILQSAMSASKVIFFEDLLLDFYDYEHDIDETISNANMSETVFDEGDESSDYNPSPEKK
jgi:hypothetical protein